MKSIPRVILCATGLVSVSILSLVTMPVNKEANVVGWSHNTTRNTTNYILVSGNWTASLAPERGVCDRPSLLVMMVCSAPMNFEARQAIRDTWGADRKVLGHSLSVYFLVGETNNGSMQNELQLESDQFGDIIQERFVDSYNNLTLKSIQMVKIATNHCLNTTRYLLKIDDDMFVNVPRLVSLILAVNETRNVLMGKLICGAKPIKNPSSKWYSPTYMYEDKTYPNYLSGTGYLMSIDVAQKLFEASLSTPIFHLEDVYMTGICARKAKVKPRDNQMFTYRQLSKEICEFRHLITMHHFNPQDIRDTFRALNDSRIEQACAHYKPKVNTRSWLFDNVIRRNRTTRRNKCS